MTTTNITNTLTSNDPIIATTTTTTPTLLPNIILKLTCAQRIHTIEEEMDKKNKEPTLTLTPVIWVRIFAMPDSRVVRMASVATMYSSKPNSMTVSQSMCTHVALKDLHRSSPGQWGNT